MDRVIKKRKWTLKKLAIYGLSGGFVLFVIYSFVFADRSSKLNVEVDKINVAEVQNGEFREFIPVDGTVLPIKTIRLDAIEGGIIEKKYYEGGINVDEGDTILKLSNNNLLQNFIREETQAFILMNQLQNTRLQMQQSLFQLQRTLITLDYQIAQAKDLYERSEQLFKEKVISEQEFLRAKLDYERLTKTREVEVKSQKVDSLNAENTINNSMALLKRTNNNLEMIRDNLENLYIRAPISGRLSTVNGEVGESIGSGQNIGQIDDINGFKVRAQIDEHYLARIYEGLKGTFDFAGGTYELTIMKNYGEVRNGLFEVDMYFESDVPEGIRRGQTLQIRLQLSENIQAIQIPRGSFYQTTGGNWIFVVDASGEFATRRNIRLGRQNPRFYEVLEGLQPGEKVVVSSYEGYQDKDRLVFK